MAIRERNRLKRNSVQDGASALNAGMMNPAGIRVNLAEVQAEKTQGSTGEPVLPWMYRA